jgi:nucleotide-binding universal stress UspA family protein
MFKKILLAIDGSAHAEKALKYARDLALRDGAQVIVVHAFQPLPSYHVSPGETWGDKIVARHITVGRELADEAGQKLQAAGIDVIVEVLEGPAADAILRVADTRQPDLIVMGSRGHGELASLLLGSVSHRVLAHTQVPVLIVKAAEKMG